MVANNPIPAKTVQGPAPQCAECQRLESLLHKTELALKDAEHQLQQAQKMEALGTLVAGVAHEINNPLNLILYNLPLLQKTWADLLPVLADHHRHAPEKKFGGFTYDFLQQHLRQLIADMEMAGQRMAKIISDLKNFSRQSNPCDQTPLDINAALALTLRQPGAYRIEVDPDGQSTTVVMRRGQAEVYGQGAAYVIDSGRSYHFTGTDLREHYRGDMPRLDDFDRWSDERDRGYDNSISSRYVSPDVIGYQDLDANGTWRSDPTYGNVWYPSRVGADWAPYQDGHWAWVDPWGWTWVDDAPWGFAVSHYGRWANLRGRWGWVPGPGRSRAYYAPALVVFLGGSNFQLRSPSGTPAASPGSRSGRARSIAPPIP